MKTKNYLSLLVFFIAFNTVSAHSFPSGLFEKLKSVNAFWEEEKTALLDQSQTYTISNNNQLIQLHLQLVEEVLRKTDMSHLNREQYNNRQYLLDQLNYYWNRGVFPVNTFHAKSQPYFVDIFGTHCAVGFLMHQSGADELIKRIKREHNYSYIEELNILYPELQEWAIINGFTLDELKWIQPTYLSPHQDIFPIGNGGGVEGSVYVMEVSPDGSLLYLAGEFTEIDGMAANSIIAWDGEQWIGIGDGVVGTIYDIHFHNSLLHIAGNFTIVGEDEVSSIANWDGEQWISMQEGETGDIYTMETYQDKLYIGGGFRYLNNIEMPFLAYYDDQSGAWSNSGYAIDDGELANLPGIFCVNDTVRTFEVYDDQLYVGGKFSLTSAGIDHPNVIQYEVNNYARWYGYIWQPALSDLNFKEINLIETVGDSLVVFGPIDPEFDFIQYLVDGLPVFSYYSYWKMDNEKPPLVYGYLRHNSHDFYYGNIDPTTTLTAGGFCNITGLFNGDFNDQVRAAASFEGNIYFAGDFTTVFGEPFNGLAYSPWEEPPVNTTESLDKEDNLYFYIAQNQLYIRSSENIEDSQLNVFSLSGQLLRSFSLNEGRNTMTLNLGDLHSGAYVFQFLNSEFQKSELLTLF